jgi:hypothetical protein
VFLSEESGVQQELAVPSQPTSRADIHLLPGHYAVWLHNVCDEGRFHVACDKCTLPSGEVRLGTVAVHEGVSGWTLSIEWQLVRTNLSQTTDWGLGPARVSSARAVNAFASQGNTSQFLLPWSDNAMNMPMFQGCYGLIADTTAPYAFGFGIAAFEWKQDPFIRVLCVNGAGMELIEADASSIDRVGLDPGFVNLSWSLEAKD